MAFLDPYATTSTHRFHAVRRNLKKTTLVLLVAGLICLTLGAGLGLYALFARESVRANMLTLSGAYLGAGLLSLLIRWPIESLRERHFRHRRRRPPAEESADQQGMVLVLVLLILALASMLALQAQLATRHALERERRAALDLRLRMAATDAARQALQRLADDPDLEVDHTNETWAAGATVTDPAGLTTQTWVQDENRFFDLNNLALPARPPARVPAEILMDLMTLCGDFEPVGKVDALLDWLDADEEGAWESAYYEDLRPPYRAANRPLLAWPELLAVKGFTRDYFARRPRRSVRESFHADLRDCLTIMPGKRAGPLPVNLNSASPEVLLTILGINQDDLVRAILVRRARSPLRSVDAALAGLEPALRESVRPYLAVRSQAFRVEVLAEAGRQRMRLRVLARRDSNGRVEVVQCVEGGRAG